jgi:hypothetical protein
LTQSRRSRYLCKKLAEQGVQVIKTIKERRLLISTLRVAGRQHWGFLESEIPVVS